MTPILADDGYCGSGKTWTAMNAACNAITNDNRKTVIVVPTKRLAKQVLRDARERFGALHARIKMIISSAKSTESTISRATKFLMAQEEGCFLIITHAAFQMIDHWARKGEWHVVIDEEMVSEVHFPVKLRRPETRATLIDLFNVRKFDDKYSVLEAVDHGLLTDIRDHLYDDKIDELFAPLTMRLLPNSPWNLFVKTSSFDEFKAGKVNRFDVHGLLDPRLLFNGFASVKVMSANIHDTLMIKYWQTIGQRMLKVNSKKPVSAGSRLIVKHLPIERWTKRLRDRIVDEEDMISVGDVYDELAEEEALKHDPSGKHMYVTNLDNDVEFVGVQLPNVPHGMNNCKDRTVCAIFSALNMQPTHQEFLLHMLQITERELRRAKISQVVYQAAYRGLLRDPKSTGDFLLIVPDSDIAHDIASMPHCEGCRVEPLVMPNEIPKPSTNPRGRPPKYDTEEERKAARRQQDWEAQRRHRTKKTMSANNTSSVSSFLISTPVKSSYAETTFLVSKWTHEAANPTPSWASEIGSIEPYRAFEGNYSCSTREFFDHLAECAKKTYSAKMQNQMMVPSIFDLKRDPFHGHSYSNLVTSQGLLMDLDHTDATPDEIAAVISPHPCAIYSSWSHRPDDCSYRVCIPTSTPMTIDVTKTVLRMLRDRFERRGFVRKHEQGRKHGIDQSALNPVKLYYQPCSRPDGVFQTYRIDGPPIIPNEWVLNAPDNVIDEVSYVPPPVIPLKDQTPVHVDRRIQGAVEHFRKTGRFKGEGRRMIYGLYKSLLEIGCDDREAARIMYQETPATNNSVERNADVKRLTGCANVWYDSPAAS